MQTSAKITTEETKTSEEGSSPAHLQSSKWAAALEKLSAEDQQQFQVTNLLSQSPHDILSDVIAATVQKKEECMKKRWKITLHGRTIILRDVLEKITVWVNKFTAIGTAVAAYDPIYTALPWAAIRFLIQSSVNDVNIFGFMLQSVEGISNVIASAAIFEVLYLDNPRQTFTVTERLSESIVSLYATVLQFLTDMLHYYSQRTAVRLVKSVGLSKADFEEKYKPIDAAKGEVSELARLAEAERGRLVLQKLDDVEASQAVQEQSLVQLLDALKQPIDRFNSELSTIKDGLEREKRIQILRSISTIPYATHHIAARKGRLKGSGQWLLQNKDFQTWRNDSTSSILWLHGIPGSGKTKLASLVIDELTGAENMAYFYCVRNPAEPLRGQCDAILSSLVRQLASTTAGSPILSPVVAQYQDALDGMAGFDDFAWTSDESSCILLELLQEYPAMTFVFDALDEVNPEDRQGLMDILSELLREAPNLLKIFITSRENYDIALHFEGSPNIYIDAQDNHGDIESFINDRLTAARLLRGQLTDDLRRKISSTLLQKAHGMFRWVDLQIQSLRTLKVAADVEARLGALPVTLEESYWDIYQDILSSGQHATDLAIFTFQWVMYAKGKILAREFASFASCALSTEQLIQTFSEAEIVDVCANLVINRTGTLEFSHLSVREFLEGLTKRDVTTVISEASHGRISAACLKYMASKFDVIDASSLSSILGEEEGDEPSQEKQEDGNTAAEDSKKTVNKEEEELQSEEAKIEPADEAEKTNEKEKRALFKDDEKAVVEYASRFWVDHTVESGSLRIEKACQDLIREFLANVATKTVSKRFHVWCWTVRNITEPPLNIAVSFKLKDAVEAPANPIWLACLHGWLEVIEYLYEVNYAGIEEARMLSSYDGRSLFSNDDSAENKISPLWYAVATGNLPLAECLLKLSPDPLQTKAKTRHQPLVRAAEDGDESWSPYSLIRNMEALKLKQLLSLLQLIKATSTHAVPFSTTIQSLDLRAPIWSSITLVGAGTSTSLIFF